MILLGGKSAPEFLMAARTLSFDSSTALSGNPTIVNDGRPMAAISTSTVMGTASRPMTAAEVIFASIYWIIHKNLLVLRMQFVLKV